MAVLLKSGENPEAAGTITYGIEGAAPTFTLDSAGNITLSGSITGAETIDWLNVKAYGAKGNGTTDDTTAVQAAFTAAGVSGGTVYLPGGTYKLTAAITFSPNVSVIGDGPKVSILKQVTANADGLAGVDSRFCDFSNFQVLGTGAGTGIGIHVTDSNPAAQANLSFANIDVISWGGDGVYVDDPITTTFTGVRVEQVGGYGFNIQIGTSLTFASCYAASCTTGGYNLKTVAYSSLAGCACDGSGIGYNIDSCTDVVLTGCGNETPTGTAFNVTGGSSNVLLGCYSSGNAGVAFNATASASKVQFVNCREVNPAGGATASFKTVAGTSATIVGSSFVTAVSLAANTANQVTSTDFYVSGNAGTSAVTSDRTSTSAFAGLSLATAGTARWSLQLRNDTTNDVHMRNNANGLSAFNIEDRATQANVQLLADTKAFGGGVGVLGIANATTLPTTTPAGGGVAYVDAGMLGWMDSNGLAVPVVAPASPEDQGLLGWSMDPMAANANLSPSAAGVIQLVRIKVRKSAASAARKLWVDNTVAGSVLTNSFVGVLDSTGTLLGTASADQSTNWAGTAGVQGLAVGTFALSPGYYYGVLLVGSATTLPQFRGGGGTTGTANFGPQTAPFRVSLSGSGLTALASVTLGSVTSGNFAILAGIS